MADINSANDRSNKSKYIDIAAQMRGRLESGIYCGRLPSYRALQTDLQITSVTLARALAELEREGLIVRRPKRGIYVASNPREAPLPEVGCYMPAPLIPTRTDSYWFEVLRGILFAATGKLRLTLFSSLADIAWSRVNGLLVLGEQVRANDRTAIPEGMPQVYLMDAPIEQPSVSIDEYGAAYRVCEYLIGLGHRRIGYLSYASFASNTVHRRHNGVLHALVRHGIEFHGDWFREPFCDEARPIMPRESGYESMRLWLADNWADLDLTALMVQNDQFAAGVVAALRDAGIRVPNHISVVGFDDTIEASIATPSITSVHVPLFEIGAAGADMLHRLLRGESTNSVLLEPNIVVRESTATPRDVVSAYYDGKG